jgi:hypothetical protein
MYEPLLERIRTLERSVQCWKLATLALAILLISFLAISGTFGVVVLLSGHGLRDVEIAREEAERARMEAEVARQQMELMEQRKRQVEAKPADGMDP